MIWHDGRLVEPGSLRVGIADRVFEHGLGLFETLRTHHGRAPLLGRHLARLRRSAADLGIDLGRVALPGRDAVAALVAAAGIGPDVLLRLTVTAGSAPAEGEPPVAWLAARPLPPPEPVPLRVRSGPVDLGPIDDPDATAVPRHKMLNYWARRQAYEAATRLGARETLLVGRPGGVLEGSRNNVLIVPRGEPRRVASPGLGLPVLPGIMRRAALDFAAASGYRVDERPVQINELFEAEAVFLSNSVRGVRAVGRIDDRSVGRPNGDEAVRLFADDLPRWIDALPDDEEALP